MERHITSESRVSATAETVGALLVSEPGTLLAVKPVPARSRRFPVEIRATTTDGAVVGQEATFELGLPEPGHDWMFSVRWEPTSHTRLLPRFRGTLEVIADGDAARLRLAGDYQPPLGPLGRFGDELIGHRVARRSLASLVSFIASRLDEAASRRRRSAMLRPPPYPESLVDG